MVQVQANKKDRMLTITGERATPEVPEEEKSMRRRRERRFGRFSRTFQVGLERDGYCHCHLLLLAHPCCCPVYSALQFSLLIGISAYKSRVVAGHLGLGGWKVGVATGVVVLGHRRDESRFLCDNQLPDCVIPWTCSFRRTRTWTASRPPSRTACSQ